MDAIRYKNLEISEDTQKRRQQIKSLQDEFMTFSWRGFDAFDNFGAFIINEKKGSLKFYNGLDFTNDYTKPQFDSNVGELMGVNFNRRKIDFTIGVYWISIEHYRLLLNWLDPMEINTLKFGFDNHYCYFAKLAKVADSTRYIVGKEKGQPMYYTELKLSFELQGAQCARGLDPYELDATSLDTMKISTNDSFIESDLPTPIEFSFSFTPSKNSLALEYSATYKLTEEQNSESTEETISLFNILFTNLVVNQTYNIRYNSETGVVYLKYGNSKGEQILSLVSTTDTGERIIQAITSNKFVLPGKFNTPDFKTSNLFFTLKEVQNEINNGNGVEISNLSFICFPRTNVI